MRLWEVLEKKLVSAEKDTRELVEKLSTMGFQYEEQEARTAASQGFQTFQNAPPDPQVLYANYEATHFTNLQDREHDTDSETEHAESSSRT